MSFIDKTNIVIKKNNNDLYYFDIDKDIVLTKINNKNDILLKGIIPKGEGKDPLRNADNRIPHNIHQILVDEKISVNPEFLRFTFYEVRVKNSVTSEEEKAFLTLAQIKLNNMGYVVYLENQEFVYNNSNMRVQPNELIIAIKEKSQSN